MQEIFAKASTIKLLICDIDGVMTDGGLFFGDNGLEYKAFHSRDGLGIMMLQRSGIPLAVITARTSDVVTHRMKNLNIDLVFQGQRNKVQAFETLCHKLQLDYTQVAYVGDDLVDLPVMRKVGLSIAVADAHERVIHQADWTTRHNGGHGAVRDVCELLMEAQGTLEEQFAVYL
ncbi:MAG: 3-deoxy-manno-octulosonate-8-phosphatase KdsC [gamma proteobacterium symbiont of Bathyaustriella thionipta]|nr:3-deoxy-manno-octulosonate-8-phosphatase KdsC [gamma proteobacterium symbiont of Bathyaustriella thionipta]MCU7948432.1 3-deoxy-manno-octulosonate-8-phosphatase KdsC [gamma proteobacterium symbiont of Bathyaustriella thionipta]MCU7954131.1 3-deoxy-manno-octulosonate-8-phosphatase KdsC [gamma proteobacterium symbiont of Bathyaustriella thionipta]MCU7955982.1 3-deoxy-manno-octulosonate-8-phosphatase KdsC [gamma proteobacterium symbiont of Bathyaustriella thionipta]MCU7968153.1 3-deoxy-manno-oc